MKRLVFAPGICQIINAAAALAQQQQDAGEPGGHDDILVLFGTARNTEFSAAMEQAAKAVWPWRAIVWAHNILVSHFPLHLFAPVARAALNDLLGGSADEIWVSKLGHETTNLVLHAFPTSRVMLFEDGAEDFIPRQVVCGWDRMRKLGPSAWLGGLRREASHWSRTPECLELDGVCLRDRRRVVAMYSYLASYLASPDCLKDVRTIPVSASVLRGRLHTLEPLYEAAQRAQPPQSPGEKAVLFLPQPFADMFLTLENEYAIYRAAVGRLLDKGYSILWKEHPREITPLAPRLKQDLGDGRLTVLRVRQQMPVESLVRGWNLAGVVSVSSTSLFYLKGLYGYPAYTAAGLIGSDGWLKWTDRELAAMFIRTLPGLDELPPAGA
mgnify:CR=1 FL=1